MNDKIYDLKGGKKLIITPEYIAITSKKTLDFQEMKKWAEMISFQKQFTKIFKKDLIQIKYNESGEQVKVKYSSPIKMDDSYTIIPKNKEEFTELTSGIHEIMSLEKKEKTENRAKFLGSSLIEILLGVFTSGILIYLTMKQNAGEEITMSSGRRQGMMRLALKIVDIIGIPATIGITIIILGLIIYRAIQRFKKPSMEIVLERKKLL